MSVCFHVLLGTVGERLPKPAVGYKSLNHSRACISFRSSHEYGPLLTRSYPEINSSFYPEWFHDHPAGLLPGPFTNWLSEVFPDLETEMYPTWMENPATEKLGTNIPVWW